MSKKVNLTKQIARTRYSIKDKEKSAMKKQLKELSRG